jgi:O-antigen ligase
LIRDHWPLGVGFGGYETAIQKYYDASGRWSPEQAHNDYLELLASGGLIGAALGVWFITALIASARRRLQSSLPLRRAACFGALVGLFGLAIHSLFDFGLHATPNTVVFMGLVAIATVKVADSPSNSVSEMAAR